MLIGCTQDLETFQNKRINCNFDYLNLSPNQIIKTEDGDVYIKDGIRIWSDKEYLRIHQRLMEKL